MGENLSTNGQRRRYPRKAEIDRVVQATRANGVVIGTIEFSPDGTIRVSSSGSTPNPKKAFDQWDEAGRL